MLHIRGADSYQTIIEPTECPNAVEAKVEGEAPEEPAKEAAWPTEPHRREEFQARGNQGSAKRLSWRWRGKRYNGRAWRSWPPNPRAILDNFGSIVGDKF